MTQHELLAFMRGLHDHVERSLSKPGPWCWPTRELLLEIECERAPVGAEVCEASTATLS